MITKAYGPLGMIYSIEEALKMRDEARKSKTEDPLFLDLASGETILPRHGHSTPLSTAASHFFKPSEDKDYEENAYERSKAISELEKMLSKTGSFSEFKHGKLIIKDKQFTHFVQYHGIVYDKFQMLYAKKYNGDEYGILVFNTQPNSRDYLTMIFQLGDEHKFEGELKNEKFLEDEEGNIIKLGDKISIATVLIKNKHFYRPNLEEGHQDNFIMLGDWMQKHLLSLYSELVFFNPETEKVEIVELRRESHKCIYSENRYYHKGKEVPLEGSEFCVRCNVKYSLDIIDFERYEIKKDSLCGKLNEGVKREQIISSHPRLKLAEIIKGQLALFPKI